MKCPDCGTENRPNATFCASCGTRLPEHVSDQPADQEKSATRACPSCGAENRSEALFCVSCGHALSEAAPTKDHPSRSKAEWISLIRKGVKGWNPILIAFLGVTIVAVAIFGGYSWGNRDRASTNPPVASEIPMDDQGAAAPADPQPSNTPRPSSTPRPTNTLPPEPTPVTRVTSKDGMVQVYVPAGNFLMGSTERDLEAAGLDPDEFSDELPQHDVYLDAYWIDQTEVTNAMFAAFLNERGNQIEHGETWMRADTDAARIHQQGGIWVPDRGYENHPVVEVRWYGAQAYCAWAGRRLPTEAEWEKAARGTEGQIYPWGNNNPSCNLVNFRQCVGDTAEVGSYPGGSSPYGALDMAGNVMEWVSDLYSETYYSNSPTSNPQGPTSGWGILRGGTWASVPFGVRVTFRFWSCRHSSSYEDSGFRCAGGTTP
jgi:formylglycine-generating enzyme required for sulfatase activity